MKRVYVMRGLPGQGKTTLAKMIAAGHEAAKERAVIVSADYHFMQPDGTYRFDRSQLPIAHAKCFDAFSKAMLEEVPVIIVDNTNVTRDEVDTYRSWGLTNGYQVFEVTAGTLDVESSFARNIHSVPAKNLERMAKRWEP